MAKKNEETAATSSLVDAVADLIDNPGYVIGTVLTNAEYDELADSFKAALIEQLTIAGQISNVDLPFISLIRDNYRVYISIRDRINGRFSEDDRFGGEKPHHLLADFRAFGKVLTDNLKECGATPKSRDMKIIKPVGVPHGNSNKSKALNIINGK